MADMLVQLLKLPALDPLVQGLREQGVIVRRAQPWEITPVRQFVGQHFYPNWADEVSVGFARQPVSVFLAIREGKIIGFSASECTRRNFFGPEGVLEGERGKGIGKALLIAGLHGLREMGYAYAIVGWAGQEEFYRKTVGAISIPDSSPGVYADPLSPS